MWVPDIKNVFVDNESDTLTLTPFRKSILSLFISDLCEDGGQCDGKGISLYLYALCLALVSDVLFLTVFTIFKMI